MRIEKVISNFVYTTPFFVSLLPAYDPFWSMVSQTDWSIEWWPTNQATDLTTNWSWATDRATDEQTKQMTN